MTVPALPPALSITHVHLAACVNTLLSKRVVESASDPIRVLDAGCGNGNLIVHLSACLSLLHPRIRLELYGFDVVDHGVQVAGFIERTVENLRQAVPQIDWGHSIRTISARDPWPFDDGFFDVVVSNQVLEHVHDPDLFFSEAHRVLRAGGSTVHLFPLKHYVWEGHLLLPLVHRIRSWDFMRSYIRLMSRLGLGKYPEHRRMNGVDLDVFSERHADYIYFWTRYMTEGEAAQRARHAGFRVTYRFTPEFYNQKIRSIFRRPRMVAYSNESRGLSDAVAVKFLRYVSSVTLTCVKDNCY